ncbi:GMC oxidoreductase [Hirsutella rhossiliensis]|uniref:GMC oxidoreductase domain-containing protein n=1 Tax=Hirsutella rhossiliensis TaxID=111463 RepID=A0A9P8MY32_9HYPO|nr:GMC oxidoreductase domain-containing protein [Hirsutella rhossiliensis]KAH0963082.1 GMC oxidoreductase domain-containing protein [Hirsutella rhossiliensis]
MELPQDHKSVATPVPDPPSDDFMSKAQWDTLYALLDACLPAIASSTSPSTDPAELLILDDDDFEKALDRAASSMRDPPSRDELKTFLEYRPTQNAKFRADCLQSLANAPQKGQLVKVLSLLGTNYGSLLLTGYWTPVARQPTRTREAIIKSWFSSRLLSLRSLAKSVAMMAQKANSVSSPYFRELSGYTDVPRNWKATRGYAFSFVQLEAGSGVHEITTDVVVVGSGCGGGVAAKNLAEAGHRVLVVDKGFHFPPAHLPMPQSAACRHLFDNGGAYISDDAAVAMVAGGAWGGGGTVNWSVCFRTQDFVRDEWAAATGLPLFTSPDYDDCLDRVWDFVGASTAAIRHNPRSQALLDGCGKLGWRAAAVEQNTASKEHYCGQCHLGCGSAEKRGPAVAWLPAAAEAGAELMEGFEVQRVVFAADGVTATGVEGLWTSRGENGQVHTPAATRTQRRVRIKATKVILAGGALWSPVLLMKSGVENRHLGRNLHVHPCNFVFATDKEDVRPWEGGIITSYSSEFENLDLKGHGVKLEPTCMVPYTVFSWHPWQDAVDAKLAALKYRNLHGFISLARDRDSGRVYPDRRTGLPRVDYTMSDFDRDHVLEGVQALAKICYVTGAKEIQPGLQGLAPFVADDGGERQRKHVAGTDPEFTDPAFGAWLAKLRELGNKPPTAAFVSAHQMGTCRMSGLGEEAGVVDGKGRVWGREGLYVADASVFPSASGVNPMVTVMALSDWISRGVAEELSAAKGLSG